MSMLPLWETRTAVSISAPLRLADMEITRRDY
jgi:hypothetical protein